MVKNVRLAISDTVIMYYWDTNINQADYQPADCYSLNNC